MWKKVKMSDFSKPVTKITELWGKWGTVVS